MRPPALAADPPHCPTCRCENHWRPYAAATLDYRACSRCQATTMAPGRDRWWWRHRLAKEFGRARGRATESLCPACKSLLQADFEVAQ